MNRSLRLCLFFMILGTAIGGLAIYLADSPWPVLLGALGGIIVGANRVAYGFASSQGVRHEL